MMSKTKGSAISDINVHRPPPKRQFESVLPHPLGVPPLAVASIHDVVCCDSHRSTESD